MRAIPGIMRKKGGLRYVREARFGWGRRNEPSLTPERVLGAIGIFQQLLAFTLPPLQGQCIMKERPCRRSRTDVAPPPLGCAVQGLRSARAALRSNCRSVSGAKGLQESIGKSAGEWHFTLRERQASTRMTFPPRRQLK